LGNPGTEFVERSAECNDQFAVAGHVATRYSRMRVHNGGGLFRILEEEDSEEGKQEESAHVIQRHTLV
jgi:hypothetical protein